MDTNILTGISSAKLHTLVIKDSNGVFQNILNLLGSGGSGGVTAATLPLSINNGTLTIDLTNYATNSSVTSAIATAIAGTISQLNAAAPLSATLTGPGSVTVESLFRPSTVSVGTGLQATASDANGTLQLSLTGTESRSVLKLADSQGTVRNLVPSLTGALTWDGSSLVDLGYLTNNYTTTTNIGSALTAGDGVFISGNTISSYDLRWDTTNTPAAPIQCLHFKNLDVVQRVNLNTSQVELVIERPANRTIAEVTGLQAEVNKLTDIVDGVSGISLGVGQGASQRIACYEIEPGQSLTAGHYFYGIGLVEMQNAGLGVGLGLWGGTGTNLPDQFGTGGKKCDVLIDINGRVGIQTFLPTEALEVTGNIKATGSITGASKAFDILHPNPVKAQQGYHMRHWVIETADSPAGSLLYRRTIDMTSTNETLQMPDWFSYIAKDVTIHMTPFEHFGSAWGRCEGNTIELHSTTLGKWHVLIMANRNDAAANECDPAVEYIPSTQTPTTDGAFPNTS